MKILVVGSGGREHAICRALAADAELIIAPGNPGTALCGRNVDVGVTDVGQLCLLARQEGTQLVVPGPEASLTAGLADALQEIGIACCGPSQKAARLEESKVFSRQLSAQLQLPQPEFTVIQDPPGLHAALAKWHGLPPVVKADGLAAGKGVFLPDTLADCASVGEALLAGQLGQAGKTILLEERLRGPEASLFYACATRSAVSLPHAQDHKRLQDANVGPNTGGMGAVSPNPLCNSELQEHIRQTFVLPVLQALEAAGTPYKGFLFVGIMLTQNGPKLLEFNVRLGDPEAQAILPRLAPGELARLCLAVAHDNLEGFVLRQDPRPTCVVVLAASGYPNQARTGDVIHIGSQMEQVDRWFIHAGTSQRQQVLHTAGGRVAAVVAQANTVAESRTQAYAGVREISFAGMQYRRDIGTAP